MLPSVLGVPEERILIHHTFIGGDFGAKNVQGALPIAYERRFKILLDSLATIRQLCRGEAVGPAVLNPWPNSVGGPPILIGSWASDIWIRRAARDFDGWLTSGGGPGGTNFRNLVEGIKRYRDEGGKRAIVATVGVDFKASSPPLTEESRFTLRCSPGEAVERIERVAELGYDDVLLRKDDLTEDDVLEVASTLRLPQFQ
jgi:alkanesulfonate monooxygenase SsuD/methylene tetrahydromethanopterin reductase-like flavin-dependent oxidoreductase (luciferase family)